MARRKRTYVVSGDVEEGYQLVSTPLDEDEDEEDDESPGRMERSAHRANMAKRETLANDLAKLPARTRRTLPLDPEILDQIDQLVAAGISSERRRWLMRAKLLLRDVDIAAVRAAMDGDTRHEAMAHEVERWTRRLRAEGDAAIAALRERYPEVDLQRVRAAVRGCAGDAPDARAVRRLHDVVRALVVAAGEASDGAGAEPS